MIQISAVIIAKNEEEKIRECLETVKWADEIVLVDSGSTDKTVEIAKQFGVRVFEQKTGKYSEWRNRGLKESNSEWVLYIDADERVTPELRDEIVKLVESEPKFPAYAIPRKNIVLGKELKHGGFGDYDYVKRLFLKNKFKHWTGDLHEEPNYIYKGSVTNGKPDELGYLKNKLIHIKAQTLEEMVRKTNLWSETEAILMLNANHPPMTVPRFLSAIGREFLFRMIKHGSFMDGTPGVIHGIYQLYSRFISYSKLWEMQLSKEKKRV